MPDKFPLVPDDTIIINISDDDVKKITKLINAWADAQDKLSADQNTVRLTFLACLQIIRTAGPAYCRIAAKTCERWAAQ